MAKLEDEWKSTGKALGHAFSDLGRTLIHTVQKGANAAGDWADGKTKTTDKKDDIIDTEIQTRDAD